MHAIHRTHLQRLALAAALAPAAALAAGEAVSFNRDIRPVLSDNCFHCHGPDEKARKAKLRLDLREEALKAGKSGAPAIVPGKPDESEVIRRILTDDADDRMPPDEAHKTLTQKQKDALRQWIAQGAAYESHWAYTPLRRPEVPKVKSPGASGEIDAFILAELESRGITPSALADKRTLLRRLSLDLTGLPPSPQEMAAFLADESPGAYEKQVDRLLASPHFGERWAVWWLDAAHFTDTVGFHGDQNQRIFPYRDYVIDAFNGNKRFDVFTAEQLAGDLLPNATVEQKIASGFNRLNMMTREGGAQPKEYLAKYGAERTRTVGTAWLGATFACAECHDHKYDPIKTKDFYALQSFFADIKQWGVYSDYGYTPNPDLKGFTNDHPFPPEIEVVSQPLLRRIAKLRAGQLAAAGETAQAIDGDAAKRTAFTEWLGAAAEFFRRHPDGWSAPQPEVGTSAAPPKKKQARENQKAAAAAAQPKQDSAKEKENASDGPEIAVQADGRILFPPKMPADTTTVTLRPPAGWVAALRIELLPDPAHSGFILRSGSAGSMSLKVKASLQSPGKKEAALPVFLAEADFKQPRFANGADIPGVSEAWVTPAAKAREAHTGVWILANPVKLSGSDVLMVHLSDNQAGCVRVAVSPFAPPLGDAQWMDKVKSALTTAATPSRDILLEAHLTGTGWNPDKLSVHRKLEKSIQECRGGKAWTMVTEAAAPLEIRVLPRGNWMDQTGEIVQPQAPHFLPQIPNPDGRRLNRLDFARWLCSPENPLTGRTIMNRLWKQFFGNGLSVVVDDLGAQGEPPSHPALLDWLAVEFRENGWDFKKMVRKMVVSAAYRRDSSLRPELRDADPNNRLLASQNPRRLDAEFVRDNALAACGLLDREMGGPSVKPYQPAGYYANLQFPNRDYAADADDRQWRRGVYMHWQRTFLHPMLANFDAPMRDECAAARIVSNTPQQALTLLNDATFVEAARVFAARLLELPGDDAVRMQTAFERTISRPARPAEAASLAAFLKSQRDYFQKNPSEAEKVQRTGIAQAKAANAVELAAWTSVCRVILNLHETITRY